MEAREADALTCQLGESRVGVASLEAIILVRRDGVDAIIGVEAEDVAMMELVEVEVVHAVNSGWIVDDSP